MTIEQEEDGEGPVVVEAQPQITVFLNNSGTVSIRSVSINFEASRVEDDLIALPLTNIRAVGEALIRLADENCV